MMSARVLVDTVGTVVSGSLGGASVAVDADGFRVLPPKAAAARSLGSAGRILRVRIRGWGAAFEAREVSAQIIADLRQSKDDLAKTVLAQTSTLVGIQSRLRGRASAQGIMHPMDEEEFCDPARLSIDIDAARLLQRKLGCDRDVVAWMRAGLLARARSSMISATGAAVRVHGLRLVVPFLLQPSEITCASTPRPGRPIWIDDRIGVLEVDHAAIVDLSSGGHVTFTGTPLEERALTVASSWPPEAFNGLLDAFRSKPSSAPSRIPDGASLPREMRFFLEPRLVRIAEAFC